ncbi:MAG: DNA (cytosine-5-)-methyltransferase [Eubacteriales bacterium]|nr:DNA (cytosine-5-)-methyltransferase [Eubacteriales bacterium]
MKNNNSLKVCSLFAGIGGIDLGFKQAGFDIVFANEIDEAACRTYRHNHSVNNLLQCDIRNLNPNDIPDFDVLAAGFPCQPFSIAGLQRGFNDPRGNLFFEIAKIIDVKRPEIVFLENVANLMNHDNGKTFLVIFSALAQFGYAVKYKILSADKHGNLPQTRRRIFVAAFKDFSKCDRFSFPDEIDLTVGINQIIHREIKQNEVYYYDEKSTFYKKYSHLITDNVSIFQPRDNGIRKTKNQMCPTLTANMGTFPNRVPVVMDDFGIRKLTLRECLDFQGFPKSFYFPNTIGINDCYKQIGNSVCVPVIKRIADCIKNVI